MNAQRDRRATEGLASIMALGYLAVLTLFAAGFLTCVNRTITETTAREQCLRCFYAAESGIEKAIAMLQHDSSYAGETNTPLDDTRVTVTLERAADVCRITSTAHLAADPMTRRRIYAETRPMGPGMTAVLRWKEVKRW
jgi:hypothetical protein